MNDLPPTFKTSMQFFPKRVLFDWWAEFKNLNHDCICVNIRAGEFPWNHYSRATSLFRRWSDVQVVPKFFNKVSRKKSGCFNIMV